MFPGEITPVPPLKTAVRLELVPDWIEVGLAVKLVMAGEAPTGVTVTVTVWVIADPTAGVIVSM